jgi:hypothetical protein
MTYGLAAVGGTWLATRWTCTLLTAVGPLPPAEELQGPRIYSLGSPEAPIGLFNVDDADLNPGPTNAAGTIAARVSYWDWIVDRDTSVSGGSPSGLCGTGLFADCPVFTAEVALRGAAPPYTALVPNLVPGATVYTAVQAVTALGAGLLTVTTPPSAAPPVLAPDAPTSPFNAAAAPLLTRLSPTSARLTYAPPAFDGGSPIVQYRIEWDGAPTFNSAACRSPNAQSNPSRMRKRSSNLASPSQACPPLRWAANA